MKRLRILFGMAVMIAGLAIYVLVAMQVAVAFLPAEGPWALLYYVAAGTIWIFPAAWLTNWMQDLPPVVAK